MAVAEQDQRQDDQLRILHWNIHSWRDASGAANLGAIADLVSEVDSHVVSLVEVDEPWGMSDTLNEIANRVGTRGYLHRPLSSDTRRPLVVLATHC